MSRDRHLNLFWTYRTAHLEDNVTRAFVVTLSKMAPVHLRLLIRDVLLAGQSSEEGRSKPNDLDSMSESNLERLREKIELLADRDLDFDLQSDRLPGETGGDRDEEEDEGKLTAENGALIGINYSGSQDDLDLSTSYATGERGSRADAVIFDKANEVTLVVEVKLRNDLYENQLLRHRRTFFAPDASGVFNQVSWTAIVDLMETIRAQTADPVEETFLEDFVEYVHRTGLIQFRGFRESDFTDEEQKRALRKFMAFSRKELEKRPDLQVVSSDNAGAPNRIDFEDVPHENLWLTLTKDGLRCGIVVGAGKKWRAQQARDLLATDKGGERVREILTGLQGEVGALIGARNSQPEVELGIHNRFYYSRFRQEFLYEYTGRKEFPSDWEEFRTVVTDPQLNTFDRIDRGTIWDRFGDAIRAKKNVETKEGFPSWKDVDDDILQNLFFGLEIVVPKDALIARTSDELRDFAVDLIEIMRNATIAVSSAIDARESFS